MGIILLFIGNVIVLSLLVVLTRDGNFDKLLCKIKYLLHKKKYDKEYEIVHNKWEERKTIYKDSYFFYDSEPTKESIVQDDMYLSDAEDILHIIFIVLLVSAVCILITASLCAISVHTDYHMEKTTALLQERYNLLTSQLKEGNNNQYIIDQVIEYNNSIIRETYASKNLWINWFADEAYINMPKITL